MMCYWLFPFTILSTLCPPLSQSHVSSIGLICVDPPIWSRAFFPLERPIDWRWWRRRRRRSSAAELSPGDEMLIEIWLQPVNVVGRDREEKQARSMCRMQIRCIWLMPLLASLTWELNKSCVISKLSPGDAQGSKISVPYCKPKTQQGQMAFLGKAPKTPRLSFLYSLKEK